MRLTRVELSTWQTLKRGTLKRAAPRSQPRPKARHARKPALPAGQAAACAGSPIAGLSLLFGHGMSALGLGAGDDLFGDVRRH